MTRKTWLRCVALLAAAFPREPMTREQIGLYEMVLAEYPDESVTQAVLHHIALSRFFPRVAEIREQLATDAHADSVDEAWGQVMREIRRVGWMGPAVWDDERTAQTVANLGWTGAGWRDLCATEIDQLDVKRAQFRQFYGAAHKRRQQESAERDISQALASRSLADGLMVIGNGGLRRGEK